MNKRIKEIKRLIFLLAIVLISFFAFCEVTKKVTVTFPNSDSPKEITYYQDGKEIAKELFDENRNVIKIIGKIPDGIVKEHLESEKLIIEETYKDGKREGIVKTYYESGKLSEEVTYKDDKREGILKTYYENGQLKEEITYKDGKQEGISKEYYESGELLREATYKDGKKEGISNRYYADGMFCFVDTYKNDKIINRKYYNTVGKLEFDQDYSSTIPQKEEQSKDESPLRETPTSLDRSIGILDLVATLIGVLVAVLTLIFIIAIAFGFFEYSRWKAIRENVEKSAKESEDKIKQTKKDAEVIKELRNKAETDIATLRIEVEKIPRPSLKEEPSKEIKEKFDDFNRRLEIIEILGISLKPEDYLNRGIDLYYKGKYELALKAFDKSIELEPNYSYAFFNKGVILGELGRCEEALKAFDKVIVLKPDYADAWYNKGLALDKLGRYEEALKSYDKAIVLKPDFVIAWNNKGTILNKLSRYEEALKAFDKATELKPDYVDAWSNKGVSLCKLGRYDEAIKVCDKAIELKPDDANAWYNKACAYSLKGDKENTLKSLSKAIELDAKLKEDAKKDEGFKNFWNDEDFKKIVS